MKWHIRNHTGEKQLVCDFSNCEKAFARPGALRDHKKRNHEKVFKHGCPICDQMFFSGSDMLRHIVVHDEARRTREKLLPSQMIKLLSEEKSEVFESSLVRITSQSLGQSCFRLEVFLKWHGTPRPCTISPEV